MDYLLAINVYIYSEGSGACLEDAPSASATQTDPTILAGLTLDADAQCQAQRGPNFSFCTGFINVSNRTMIYSALVTKPAKINHAVVWQSAGLAGPRSS